MPTVSLDELPDFLGDGTYKCDPYIRAAARLQSLGREPAFGALAVLAGPPGEDEDHKLVILCRMLFTPRPGVLLRRPGIGVFGLLGGTRERDWPDWPIELVDGVPFLVTTAYRSFVGIPETGGEFFGHCLSYAVWSDFRYVVRSAEEKAAALAKLLGSNRWKARLAPHEVEHLSAQVA